MNSRNKNWNTLTGLGTRLSVPQFFVCGIVFIAAMDVIGQRFLHHKLVAWIDLVGLTVLTIASCGIHYHWRSKEKEARRIQQLQRYKQARQQRQQSIIISTVPANTATANSLFSTDTSPSIA